MLIRGSHTCSQETIAQLWSPFCSCLCSCAAEMWVSPPWCIRLPAMLSAPISLHSRQCIISKIVRCAPGSRVLKVSTIDPRLFVPARPKVQEAQIPLQRMSDAQVQRPVLVQTSGTSYLPEEDALILQARELNKSWVEIASMLPGRSSTAIRKHYTNTLRPKVSPHPLVLVINSSFPASREHCLVPHNTMHFSAGRNSCRCCSRPPQGGQRKVGRTAAGSLPLRPLPEAPEQLRLQVA